MNHVSFVLCTMQLLPQNTTSLFRPIFTGPRVLVSKPCTLALTRVLTWFLFSTGISSSGVIWSPPWGAFSWFSVQCPTLPLALELERISGSFSCKVQSEEDSETLCFISGGNQVLWASKAPLRRHQGDIYSGSCWDLRQDLQEMIVRGHVVGLKL